MRPGAGHDRLGDVNDRGGAHVHRAVEDHVDVKGGDLPALAAVDDGQAAAGQPGIYSHYPHVRPLLCEHLFESLTGRSDAFRHDTRVQLHTAVPRGQRPPRRKQGFCGSQRAGQNEGALQRADQSEGHIAGL